MNEDGARNFRTTHWSALLHAKESGDSYSAAALEHLCRVYWHPLYSYVRRRGYGPHEAQDLTQEFFAQLLQRHFLDDVGPEKGRFRSFLLASMKNFLANEWRRAQRIKRGGAIALFSLDEQDAEQRFVAEPLDDATPERLFLRRWVDTVLDQVMERLREELAANGYADRFEILKDFLVRDSGVSYEEVAEQLGLSLNAAGSVIHRLRSRFRQLFRHEIAQTVASPDEVDDEIRCLLGAL